MFCCLHLPGRSCSEHLTPITAWEVARLLRYRCTACTWVGHWGGGGGQMPACRSLPAVGRTCTCCPHAVGACISALTARCICHAGHHRTSCLGCCLPAWVGGPSLCTWREEHHASASASHLPACTCLPLHCTSLHSLGTLYFVSSPLRCRSTARMPYLVGTFLYRFALRGGACYLTCTTAYSLPAEFTATFYRYRSCRLGCRLRI